MLTFRCWIRCNSEHLIVVQFVGNSLLAVLSVGNSLKLMDHRRGRREKGL